MSEQLSRFDAWIDEGGPSALVSKEYLEPVAGQGAVIFPPTFAPPEDKRKEPAGYIIDRDGDRSVCLIDSVGSQANRLEPLFKQKEFEQLVPQVRIKVKDRVVNLLDVGHRAADSLVRSTKLAADLEKAFLRCAAGDPLSLAKIAPTTLVFGAWDSRGSLTKIPRLIDSTIRAFQVDKLNRAAQYHASLTNDEVAEMLQTDVQKDHKPLSKAGFLDAPSGRTHGGVIARGDIVRTTVLNLTALRSLGEPADDGQRVLRRYILGLCLIVACAPIDLYLRQGCLLVRAAEPPENTAAKPFESNLVYRDGRRKEFQVVFDEVLAFARGAAHAFVVGPSCEVEFDSKAAKELVKKAAKEKEDAR